jgi:hypothetical protein
MVCDVALAMVVLMVATLDALWGLVTDDVMVVETDDMSALKSVYGWVAKLAYPPVLKMECEKDAQKAPQLVDYLE